MKLEIGYSHDFEIRKEVYYTQATSNFSILFLSDLHLNGFSSKLISDLKNSIEALNPTIILLGGDYIDTKKGFGFFREFLFFLSKRKNIYAIAGNHDNFYGINKIKDIVINHKIIWLDKTEAQLYLGNFSIQISNNNLTIGDKNVDFKILLQHNPASIDKANDKFNLAFAGHLHGCQFVFWHNEKGLFPGRFFYKWNRLKAQIDNTLYLISKGLGDTLPMRYNCKKDIVFVEVLEQQNDDDNLIKNI